MGKRDCQRREPKKPKKSAKKLDTIEPLSSEAAVTEVIRKRKNRGPGEE